MSTRDRALAGGGDDPARGLDAVELGHADVHQHDVGLEVVGHRRPPRRRRTASPTTSRSSSASRIILNPARTSAWSSAIRMRTVISGGLLGHGREGSRAHACSARPSTGMRARTSKPPPARRPGVQLAAEDAHALAHADEPVAAAAHAAGRAGPGPAVADLQLDVLAAVADVHLGRRGAGVLDGVGDRLLDDAVGGEVDARRAAGGARPRRSAPPAGRRRARARRARRGRRASGAGAPARSVQHAEQAPQLGERLAAGAVDQLRPPRARAAGRARGSAARRPPARP